MPSITKYPVTDNHYLLPLRKEKYAPSKLLSTDTKSKALDHFLELYSQLCVHYDIVSSPEKCKGLIGYCTNKMARRIEGYPSYVKGDYDQLVKDLYYFAKDDDNNYNLTEINNFTAKWRRQNIETHEKFKTYHWKFLALVGRAIGTGAIDQKEYNRYFWEGIHKTLRKRIEERLMVANPNLDLSIPFKMEAVVKAVETMFNRKRFDQHLLGKGEDSDSDSEEDEYKPTKVHLESEDEKNSDSDKSDEPRKRSSRKKPFHPPHLTPPRRDPAIPKKVTRNKIAELSQQMEALKLFLMKREPEYPRMDQHPRNANYSQPQTFLRPQFGNLPIFS